MGLRLAVGVLAACCGALGAWRLGWLRPGGAAAAAAVGAAVFGLAGWAGALPLLAFFVSSTLLGRLPGRERHAARSGRQVLANGAVAAMAALAAALHAAWGLPALAGALAAANADTWATELGTRFGGRPRRVALGPAGAPGDSGAVTALGTLGGCAGAVLVAALAGGLPAACGGIAGLLADSLLGGTLQGVYRCPECGARTESRTGHGCAAAPRLARGLSWLDNDGVNLAATLIGAALGGALAALGRG